MSNTSFTRFVVAALLIFGPALSLPISPSPGLSLTTCVLASTR